MFSKYISESTIILFYFNNYLFYVFNICYKNQLLKSNYSYKNSLYKILNNVLPKT